MAIIAVITAALFPFHHPQLIGSILAVSSGLPVGKEGPLLHIGASVGAMIGDKGFLFGVFKMRSRDDEAFFMNYDTRELVAAGAVSGVAAALKAPVNWGLGQSLLVC